MRQSSFLFMFAIILLATSLSSCDNEEEDMRCFTVKVLVTGTETIYGEIIQVPEDNFMKTESGEGFQVFSGTRISFPSECINLQLNAGDVIDIRLIEYELYQGIIPALYSVPIIAPKVQLCK